MNYTDEDIELAKKIVNKFEEFAPAEDIYCCSDEEESCSVNHELNQLVDFCKEEWGISLMYFMGASKLVFTTPSLPFVIKFGFSGYMEYHDDYDEEEDVYDEGGYEMVYFDGSESGDYAEDEYQIYEEVKKDGYGQHLAEVQRLCRTDIRAYYIQESCNTFGEFSYQEVSEQASKDSLHFIKEMSKVDKAYRSKEFDDVWCAIFLDKYDECAMTDFLYYLYNENCDLMEDMHIYNYGFRMSTGEPVLIDYSGYHC